MTKKYEPAVLEIYDKILKIQKSGKSKRMMLGDFGEAFVEEGIKQCLWKKEYRFIKNKRLKNKTFKLKVHYKPEKKGMGGIDYYLRFRNQGKTHRCFIEVKNWDDILYSNPRVSDDRFNKQILKRYTRNDKFGIRHRILVIPVGYVKNINKRCVRNNITIVSLPFQIFPALLSKSLIDSNYQHFIKDFSIVIDDIINANIQISGNKYVAKIVKWKTKAMDYICKRLEKPKDNNQIGKTKTEKIRDDIIKGMAAKSIANKYNSSISYVYKVKSNMKKEGKI